MDFIKDHVYACHFNDVIFYGIYQTSKSNIHTFIYIFDTDDTEWLLSIFNFIEDNDDFIEYIGDIYSHPEYYI